MLDINEKPISGEWEWLDANTFRMRRTYFDDGQLNESVNIISQINKQGYFIHIAIYMNGEHIADQLMDGQLLPEQIKARPKAEDE